jgi:preprotein translocase subunit SecG
MGIYLSVVQIVLSTALVLAILVQVRGGGLGGIFGQADSVYRSRRGVEKTLYRLTIVLVVLFVAVSLATLMIT